MSSAARTAIVLAGVMMASGLPVASQTASASRVADQRSVQSSLVAQFFPARLLDFEANTTVRYGVPLSRESAFVAADLDHTGSQDYLVAVYTASELGAVRVLKIAGGSASLADEPNLCTFGGHDPQVSLINLDRSGNSAVSVTLAAGSRGEEVQWIFKWDGRTLRSIGPGKDRHGLPCTELFDASLVDLDGDGVLEIIAPPMSSLPDMQAAEPLTYRVYSMTSSGAYARSGVFEYFALFGTGGGPFGGRSETFAATAPGSPYAMTIANGDGRDVPPVDSAEVLLNGEAVTTPGQITKTARWFKIPVTVKANNTVEVHTSGPKGSMLYIGVGPAQLPAAESAAKANQ